MSRVYFPQKDGMYKRLEVADPEPYLNDGWFGSIADHQSSVADAEECAPVTVPLFAEEKLKAKSKANKKAG